MLFTGKGVDVFRLRTLILAVSMEAQGFKNRRSARKMLALELGLKSSAKHADVIAAGTERLKALIVEARAEGGIQP